MLKESRYTSLSGVEIVYELENINGAVLMMDNAAIIGASAVIEEFDEVSIPTPTLGLHL